MRLSAEEPLRLIGHRFAGTANGGGFGLEFGLEFGLVGLSGLDSVWVRFTKCGFWGEKGRKFGLPGLDRFTVGRGNGRGVRIAWCVVGKDQRDGNDEKAAVGRLLPGFVGLAVGSFCGRGNVRALRQHRPTCIAIMTKHSVISKCAC